MEFATASQNVRGLVEISVDFSGPRRGDWMRFGVLSGANRNHDRAERRAKKNPNERFGFNPPKEEVEETAEVAQLLQPMDRLYEAPLCDARTFAL